MVGNRRGNLANMQTSPKSNTTYENGSSSRACSRLIPACEQHSQILRPRGTLNMQRPATNSSFPSYRNKFERMNLDARKSNDSGSPFSESSSSTTLPSKASRAKLKNAMTCLSCPSDESGSDCDMKTHMVTNSETRDMDSWSSLASSSSSSEGSSSSLLGGTKYSLTGMKKDIAGSVSYGESMSTRRTNVPSSSIRHGLSSHTSRTCPDSGNRSSTLNGGLSGWGNLQKKRDTFTDRVDMSVGSKLVNKPRQVSSNNTRPESKRKSSTQTWRGERVRPWSSHGAGYKDIDNSACNPSMAGSSHLSARSHVSVLATDIQTADTNSSVPNATENGFLVENGAGSSGFLNEVDTGTSYTDSGRRMSSPPVFIGGPSSSTLRHGDKSVVHRRSSRNLPSSSNSNHLSAHPVPDQSRDIYLETSLRSSRHPGFIGGERDMTRRSLEKQPTSSSALSMQERPLGFSGPPPSRPPPLPPLGSASASTENISIPPSSTTDPHPLFVSRFTRPSADCGPGRPNLLTVGSSSHPGPSGSSSQYVQPHLAVEGLSEVLSALQRIEREDDLSYEQILMLEATVLLGGLGLSDRHRDMRLDVDNMSYEELLALEERIGDVKMGLSDETITKCVRRQMYVPPALSTTCTADDVAVKCSICQEEFEEGMDVGLLDCGHCHHFLCIKEWLQQKNRCPICKAPASV